MPGTSSEALQEANVRPTAFRVTVLDAIVANPQPQSFASLHERVGGDTVTLYRTLHLFVAHNLVHRISTDLREWLYAGGTSEQHTVHPHSVCTRCGAVRCIEQQFQLVQFVEDLGVPPEFLVRSCDVVIHGRCERCRQGQG